MASDKKFTTVDRFIGINEAIDGETELKPGEASRCENWYITDGLNLETRPGVLKLDFPGRIRGTTIAAWSGKVEMGTEYLCLVDYAEGTDHIYLFTPLPDGRKRMVLAQHGAIGIVGDTGTETASGDNITAVFRLPDDVDAVLSATVFFTEQPGTFDRDTHLFTFDNPPAGGLDNIVFTVARSTAAGANVKIFPFAGYLYIMSAFGTVRWDGERFVPADYYVPKVVTAAPPAGGGTLLENVNQLTNKRRIDYSADGTATSYRLPLEAKEIDWVKVDNQPVTDGTWNRDAHTYTFQTAPVKGVGNVEFQYSADPAETETTYAAIAACTLSEAYNGSADTRLFVGGDGTNKLYYTGVPLEAPMSSLYFPAMNEISVDMSASPVMGFVRHYSKLLVFKPDGAFTISYDTIYMEDGRQAAGFRLQAANREYGSDILGQIQTVDNFPRTVTKGGIYEWNITASYYRDERYAKRVSERVMQSLEQANIDDIVTCDDNYTHTYYAYLNDADGTVLVNRYSVARGGGIWFLYKSQAFRGVRYALMHGGRMTIIRADGQMSQLEKSYPYDNVGDQTVPIISRWESGYNPFGVDYRRKSSGLIYVSCIPRGSGKLKITAATDRKSGEDGYAEKVVSNSLFSFSTLRFSALSFGNNPTPHINRVKLKIKKFVYYKLIFKADEPGCQASILSYDQEIRFSGMAK